MDSSFKTAFGVCLGLALLVGILAFVSNNTYRFANAGVCMILAAIVYFFIGLLLLIPKTARKAGQAMLLCSVLILLIGASICSMGPFSFH